MKLQTKSIDWFKPNARNPRSHPEPQVAHIASSLRSLGQFKNVVARPDGTLLVGHGVVEAAKAEGLKDLAVFIFEGDDLQAQKLLVADNELSRLAVNDQAELAALLQELDAAGELPGTRPARWTRAGEIAYVGSTGSGNRHNVISRSGSGGRAAYRTGTSLVVSS